MPKVETVTIPRAMYEDMEQKCIELLAITTVFKDCAECLTPFTITAVITSPPSGSSANKILSEVRHLIAIATRYSELRPQTT